MAKKHDEPERLTRKTRIDGRLKALGGRILGRQRPTNLATDVRFAKVRI